MDNPTISIITVCFNNREGLIKTIDSVLKQTYKSIEFIIVDGLSDDGSADIIKKNEKHFAYWVSEKDNGVYDAMNKGILKANGDYCLFLNSGDWLNDNDVLEKIAVDLDGSDLVYGDLYIEISPKKKIALSYKNKKINRWFFISTNGLPHQATFIKTSLLKKNTPAYSYSFPIAADHDFFSRSVLNNYATLKYTPNIITNYSITGMSCKFGNAHRILKERYRISKCFLNKKFLIPYFIYFVPKFYLRMLLRNIVVSLLN